MLGGQPRIQSPCPLLGPSPPLQKLSGCSPVRFGPPEPGSAGSSRGSPKPGTEERPRPPQERPKSGPRAAKRGLRRPRTTQERPRATQDGPKSGQGRPKSAQEQPKSAQERSRAIQKDLRMAQERPRFHGHAQDETKSGQDRFGFDSLPL